MGGTSGEGDFNAPVFGTDGLRGRVGAPPMEPETLRRVGAALGLVLQQHGDEKKRVVIGNDGRDSSEWILESLAQGVAAADVAVHDVGLCTTPALAFLSRSEPYDCGIMISASHNPADDNGVKIFGHDGRKFSDELEAEIAALTRSLEPAERRTPSIKPRDELLGRYEQHLGDTFPDLDLEGLTIVVDAANGGGSILAPTTLRRFGAEVIEIGCEPDGFNINAGVGALHPEQVARRVLADGADFGLSLDGDGDRGMFVDEQGNVRDGDHVLALFGHHLARNRQLPGDTVVATVMSNLGLHKSLGEAGARVLVTPVGDRSVMQAMVEGGYAIGGEQSGHILFDGDGHLTGDGLFTALKILSLPQARTGIARAFPPFTRFPQTLINVQVSHKPELSSIPEIAEAVTAAERTLGDQGRVLLRYSGTEDLCRVMVEAPTEEQVRQLAHGIADMISKVLKQ